MLVHVTITKLCCLHHNLTSTYGYRDKSSKFKDVNEV